MGYPTSIEEFTEADLHIELRRRKDLQDQGLCDYCARSVLLPACRFPRRHVAGKSAPALIPHEVAEKLAKALESYHRVANGVPYAQWSPDMHRADDALAAWAPYRRRKQSSRRFG